MENTTGDWKSHFSLSQYMPNCFLIRNLFIGVREKHGPFCIEKDIDINI